MKLSEYLVDYHILTDVQADNFSFLTKEKLPFLERMLGHNFGCREMFADETDVALEAKIQTIVNDILTDNSYKLTKLNATLSLQYDVLSPTSTEEHTVIINSGTDSAQGSNTPNETTTISKNTYDNNDFSPTDKSEVVGTNGSSNVITYGKKEDNTINRTGYENANFKNMIEDERKIADFKFFSIMADIIANELTLATYDI